MPGQASKEVEDLEEEYQKLHKQHAFKRVATKEIEATVAGGESYTERRTLPSTFDFYPPVKRLAEMLHKSGKLQEAITLLRGLEALVSMGDERVVKEMLDKHWDPDVDEEKHEKQEGDGQEYKKESNRFTWQVHCGDGEGWRDFDEETNRKAEQAYMKQEDKVTYIGFQRYKYTLDLKAMIQRNDNTGTARPVRRV